MSDKIRVLEAIDHLRSRKARPDITRISAYLSKNYGFSFESSKKAIAKSVEDSSVFRVEYKGFISYRNASKSRHGRFNNLDTKRGPPAGGALLMRIYDKLLLEAPDIAQKGVQRFRFITALLKEKPRRSHAYFNLLIDRAINRGLFTKLANGNIISKNKTSKSIELNENEIRASFSPKSNKNSKMTSLQRKQWLLKQWSGKDKHKSLDRRKRIRQKKIDPSEDMEVTQKGSIVKNKINSTLGLSTNPSQSPKYRICAVCQKLITTDKRDSKMTMCKVCSSISHSSCAYINPNMRTLKNSWKCPQCTSCKNCKRTSVTSPLILCANCTSAYHKQCHKPYIKEGIHDQSFWLCGSCANVNDKDNIIAKSKFFCIPGHISRLKYHPSEHKMIWQNFKQRKFGADEDEPEDPTIPDIRHWTTGQVYKHIFTLCPGAALSFKERNIDGPYLLKMSRVEIIQGLGLKLGAALKVFKEVVILQKRRNDPKSYYL